MANERHALLDTDFISKTHLIRKDDQNRFIDKILSLPNYTFYCHEQISIELLRHNFVGLSEWFEDKVENKFIYLYDDEMILDELSAIYGDLALAMYVDMLKTACSAYKYGYFEDNFVEMSKVNALCVSREDFLKKLVLDCNAMGTGNNLGELKSYVLLQVLNIKFGQQVYIFCSDDKNARNGIVAMGEASCISVLSSFIRLKKEIDFNREDAEPYIRSYMNYCLGKD